MDEVDVLVVGAGPTGLTAAIELARRGTAIRIIDKVMPRPYAESRAEGLHARSLEIFQRQGLLDAVLAHGRVLAGFEFRTGRRRLGELSAYGLDTPHPYSVLLPQSEIERLQIERLRELGVDVERPVEVLDIAQDHDRAHAQIRSADGTVGTVTAQYVIAADGAHSLLRKALGVAFDGSKLQGAYVMDADVEFEAEPPPDRGTFILGRGGFMVVGLRPDGSYRIALSLPASDRRISTAVPGIDELQMLLDDFPEMGVRLQSVAWSSAFFISSRSVGRLRHGRVYLVGDAAHIHSPVGGQGMNTGIGDAMNLSWKLALAARGQASQRLLDSYQAERLPVIRRLIASTTASTRPLLWRNPIAVAVRNQLLRLALPLPALQTGLFEAFTGFSVRYRSGALVAAARHGRRPRGPQPGDIAPEALRANSGWYRQWGADTRHQLLVFGGPGGSGGDALAWAAEHRDLVRPLLVTTRASATTVNSVADPAGALRRRYAVPPSGLSYLVRPDGFIAARSQVDDLSPLNAYLDTFLGSSVSGRSHYQRDAPGRSVT